MQLKEDVSSLWTLFYEVCHALNFGMVDLYACLISRGCQQVIDVIHLRPRGAGCILLSATVVRSSAALKCI